MSLGHQDHAFCEPVTHETPIYHTVESFKGTNEWKQEENQVQLESHVVSDNEPINMMFMSCC